MKSLPALEYPKEAFVVVLFVTNKKGEAKAINTYEGILFSLKDVSRAISAASSFNDSVNTWKINDVCAVIPITLVSLYPLKPEYWENPTENYDVFIRGALFNDAVANLPLYKLLVTPIFSIDERKWFFNAAIPFKITAKDKEIENFMLHSDYQVDERADSAGIYLFGKPIRYNWKKKIVEKKEFKYFRKSQN